MPTLSAWRDLATPHADVLAGTFQQADFAADLWQVHTRRAPADYRDPATFYQRTFLTEGIRQLLVGTAQRLTGIGGEAVVQLQTSFGGGKTHSMLAVYHLVARGNGTVPVEELLGVGPLLAAAEVPALPPARIVVLDGSALRPAGPTIHPDSTARTLWGELALQLGGAAYEQVRAADETGTSPGKAALIRVLEEAAPCVVLLDEVVAYVRQFTDGQTTRLAGGDLNSNLSFIQALTEAVKSVPTAQLIVSLPDSEVEAGNAEAVATQRRIEKVVGRVRALWKPAANDESFEIVRRRLFSKFGAQEEINRVCRHYAHLYTEHPDYFPEDARHSTYYDRLLAAYPLHPELLDRLYQDWSSLENFHRTRGVLKLLAQVIYRLWQDNDQDPLIQPANLPLQDQRVRAELLSHLPPGWEPVIVRDVDDKLSEPVGLDNRDDRFGSVRAATRVARTVFLGSAPNTGMGKMGRGLTQGRILLGAAKPGPSPAVFADALQILIDRLHYLTQEGVRYWYDVRPNMRREMEERRARLDKHDVLDKIAKTVQAILPASSTFKVSIFPDATDGIDIPDDQHLRLVVLDPVLAPYDRKEPGRAQEAARIQLEQKGGIARQRRNRLLFLAAEAADVRRLLDQAGTVLAWAGIEEDVKNFRLTSDTMQERQLAGFRKDAQIKLDRATRETFKWLLVPEAEAPTGGATTVRWVGTEEPLKTSSLQPLAKEIEQRLMSNEWLISGDWSAKHLQPFLRDMFWRLDQPAVTVDAIWDACCNYLYLPRLTSREVLVRAVEEGTTTGAFGLASAQTATDAFTDASVGSKRQVSGTTLLVEPSVLTAFLEAQQAKKAVQAQSALPVTAIYAAGSTSTGLWQEPDAGSNALSDTTPPLSNQPEAPRPKVFTLSMTLDAKTAKSQFNNLIEEIVRELTGKVGVTLSLSVDLRAEAEAGFDATTARNLRENSKTLNVQAHFD